MRFKKYRRTGISELRPVTELEVEDGLNALIDQYISISQADIDNGSPLLGDFIARDPKNHANKWLINAQYVQDNLEEIS